MTLWNDMVIGICLLLAALLLWKEFRRPDRSRLTLRLAATVLAVAGLAGLILPFSFTRKTNAIRQKEKKPPPFAAHTGIVSISWQQKLLPGEKLRIQGNLYNASGKAVKLILCDDNTILDSTVIDTGMHMGRGDFELHSIPAQSGRAVYHLVALQYEGTGSARGGAAVAGSGDGRDVAAAAGSVGGGGIAADTLEQEDIPVEVLPVKKLTILLLASSPDFENRFLARWLSQNDHMVAMRTAISKDKYDKAYLNMPAVSLDRLTPALLDKFDVLIADAEALRSVGVPELTCLRRQVAEKGLGVIIRADSAGVGWSSAAGLAVVKDSSQQFYIQESPGTQPLVRDSLSRIVAGGGLYGAGKLLLITRNDMYTRLLAGDKKEYTGWWSLLLQTAAREADPVEEWRWVPALPRVGEPVRVLLQTNAAGLPQGEFGAVEGEGGGDAGAGDPAGGVRAVYLGQHPLLPFRWEGRYWPEAAGWQTGRTLRGDTCWWYAWPGHAWQNLDVNVRDAGGRDAATRMDGKGKGGATGPSEDGRGKDGGVRGGMVRVPVPKAWFYALLVLGCFGLWIEKKI